MKSSTFMELMEVLKKELSLRGFTSQSHAIKTCHEDTDCSLFKDLSEVEGVFFRGCISGKTLDVSFIRNQEGVFVTPTDITASNSNMKIDDDDLFLNYRHFIVHKSLNITK